MLGIEDDFLDETVDKGPSDYWECRRQLLLLERMHVKFEYLFRVGEFVLGSTVFVVGFGSLTSEWGDFGAPLLLYSAAMLVGVGVIFYVRLRKRPELPAKSAENKIADTD